MPAMCLCKKSGTIRTLPTLTCRTGQTANDENQSSSALADIAKNLEIDPMTRFMKYLFIATLPALALSAPASAESIDRVEIGQLDCAVKGGEGFVFKSTKDLSCTFKSAEAGVPDEAYFGAINKFGLDIGTTDHGVISWLVMAPTTDDYRPGALAGDYAGVSAQATVGAGVGGNLLVGGSDETIALQPLSVSAQTGLNFALAISELQLRSLAD